MRGEILAVILDVLGESMEEWRTSEEKILIWGNLGTACMIARFLERNGITFDGFVINRKYYEKSSKQIMGHIVYCLEDYLMHDACRLIIGFSGYADSMLSALNASNIRKIYLYDFLGMLALDDDNTIDDAYMRDNEGIISDLRNMLCDEKSKDTLDAFLSQKLTGAYRKKFDSTKQYFDQGIVALEKDEVFVDCGAFQGETVIDFIDALSRQKINDWKEIIAIEADPNNVARMKENLQRYGAIQICESAISDTGGGVYKMGHKWTKFKDIRRWQGTGAPSNDR